MVLEHIWVSVHARSIESILNIGTDLGSYVEQTVSTVFRSVLCENFEVFAVTLKQRPQTRFPAIP